MNTNILNSFGFVDIQNEPSLIAPNIEIPIESDIYKPYSGLVEKGHGLSILFVFASLPSGGLFETKTLEASLSFKGMADLKKKEGLNKLPLIKDDKVKLWIDSNEFFGEVIGSITNEIEESTKDFDIEIKDMYIKNAYPSDEDNDLEEFVIMVKVPQGTDIDKINEFWDYIGTKSTEFLDEKIEINPNTAEVDEKLLIVVREEEN